MNDREIIKGVLLSEDKTYSFIEVCQHCHLSEDILVDFIAHGLLGDDKLLSYETYTTIQFSHHMLNRIRTASRLHHELEVNLQGVVLALELLDELTEIRSELNIVRKLYSNEREM